MELILANKLAELGYESFDGLTSHQQTEVAKLFLITKGDTEYKTVDEIVKAIDVAIDSYIDILDVVNEAANATAMKTALDAVGNLTGVPVAEEMAAKAVAGKSADGYASVKEIIAVLTPAQ